MNNKHTSTPPKNSVVMVYNRRVDISTPAGRRAHEILRQCEIMDQCGTLINTSNNLETVIRNVPLYEKSLHYLTQCSDSDLKMCRLKSQRQLKDMYAAWFVKKNGVLNNAVMRSCRAAVDHAKTLKTQKGQANYMDRYFAKNLALSGLLPENIALLKDLQYQWEHSY